MESRARLPRPAGEGERQGHVVVEDLTWRPYGRREPVLRDLSLDIPAGQRVLLVGPSGSGKSTLLRALGGLLETADAGDLGGSVTVDGREPHARPGTVGLVLQEPGAGVVAATVGRDVAFGLENGGVPREEMPPLVAAALDAVHLRMPHDTPTHALSGGETQRLAIAGALALGPSVLLLDEPTAMLDPVNAAHVRESVAEVAAERSLTTVVVEHVLGPWVDFADRLIALDGDGALIADGGPRDVLRDHGERLADLGIWVPGIPDPTPLPFAAEPTHPHVAMAPQEAEVSHHVGEFSTAVAATDLVVDRKVVIDGLERIRRTLDSRALDVEPGRATALVGPSGSGKSTLLLALGGLLEPSSGQVTDRERRALADLGSKELAEVVAWVPQWSSSTIVAQTVLDEALATSTALGRDLDAARQRAATVLDVLGLGDLHDADPRQLSGGEQRRLALAAAIVHDPCVLLADEPTVGQDRHTWAAVLGLVEAVRASGAAVVVSTHDRAVIERADDIRRLSAEGHGLIDPAPRRPLITRCGPLSLFAAALLAVVASLASRTWQSSAAAIAVEVALCAVALVTVGDGPPPHGRARRLALRLAPGLLATLSVAWSTWLLGGHDLVLAVEAGLRIVVLVLPSAVLLPYVDADALGDHLAQRLRLPARPVVALSAALHRLQTFSQMWDELSRARRVRGLGPGRSPVASVKHAAALTMGMLVRTLHTAAELAVAMDARGFATAYRRTWATPAPWRLPDTLAVLGGGAVVAAVVVTAVLTG